MCQEIGDKKKLKCAILRAFNYVNEQMASLKLVAMFVVMVVVVVVVMAAVP